MADKKQPPMAMIPKSPSSPDIDYNTSVGGTLTLQGLNTILEVNQKALTIYLEVEKQNEEIIDILNEEVIEILKEKEELKQLAIILGHVEHIRREHEKLQLTVHELKDANKASHDKLSDIDKALFRLYLVLGSTVVGAILNLIQMFLHK